MCSAEQRYSYMFGTTWGWVNYDSIFIFVPLRPVIRPVTIFDISKFILPLLSSSSLGEKNWKKLLSNQTNPFVFWVKFIFSRRGVVERRVKHWAVRHWDRQTEGRAAGADRDAGGHAERTVALTAISPPCSHQYSSTAWRCSIPAPLAWQAEQQIFISMRPPPPPPRPLSLQEVCSTQGLTEQLLKRPTSASHRWCHRGLHKTERYLTHGPRAPPPNPPPASNNHLLVLTSPSAGSKYCGSLVLTQRFSPRTETAATAGITALINT